MAVNSEQIIKARKTMADAFREDSDFKQGYIANVAMLMHDRGWLKRPNADRNEAAEAVIDLIFGGKR